MSDSQVADELAIRSLVARYAEAVAARDEKTWADTWANDGEWHVLGRSPKGREEIVEVWNQLMGGLEFVVQHAASGTVDIDGDHATGRWQVIEFGKLVGGGAMMNIGLYRDECVRENGEWRFRKRIFSPLYVGPPDLSAAAIPFPEE